MSETLAKAVERLEVTLKRETETLRAGHPIDLAGFTQSKNQSLLELTRLQRGLSAQPEDATLKDALVRLDDALSANRRALEAHITASRDISQLVSDSLAARESDGTYSDRRIAR